MQKVGPPPAYPGLKIPGLNAPIPRGARWGFHPGGWGQPPRDEFGRPLYGDVFGVLESVTKVETVPVERELWGQIEVEVEEEVDDDDEESEAETYENEIKMEDSDDVPGIDVEPTVWKRRAGLVRQLFRSRSLLS
jgi:splicing factor 3B subunit 2